MESANSSNSQAILKEMYSGRKRRKIPHMADGGEVPDALYEENPQAQVAAQGMQQLGQMAYESQPIQNVISGEPLQDFNTNLHQAIAGDPTAQDYIAGHSLGTVMGSINNVAPGIKIIEEAAPETYGAVTKALSDTPQTVYRGGQGSAFGYSPAETVASDVPLGKIIRKPYDEGGQITPQPGPAPMSYTAPNTLEGAAALKQGLPADPGEISGIQQANDIPETLGMMALPEAYAAAKGIKSGLEALGEEGAVNLSKQGLKKALPMDEASRMIRAEEMGFDTSKTYYHGTKASNIEEFNPSLAAKDSRNDTEDLEDRVAGFFTEEPNFANRYARATRDTSPTGSNVIPVHLKTNNTFDYENSKHINDVFKRLSPDTIEQLQDIFPLVNNKPISIKELKQQASLGSFNLLEHPDVVDAIKDAGFDSMHIFENGEKNIAVFEPHQIRSKFAAFDPKQAKSGKLSYADGGEISQAPISTESPETLPANYQFEEDKYGSGIEQAKAFGEGALQGVLGPFGPVAEQAASQTLFNQTPEETSANIRGREAINPMTHLAGELTGLGASMATGVGEGAVAANLGERAVLRTLPTTERAALGEFGAVEQSMAAKEIISSKIGSRAVNDAIANMAISAGDEASKLVLQDPNQSVETAAVNLGLSGIIGGTVGVGIGSISELWKAGVAPKAADALHAITERLGGVEGRTPNAVNEVLQMSGLKLDPAQKAVLSGDPQAQSLFTHLLQTDIDASGKEIQAGYDKVHKDAADLMIQQLGKDPSKVIPSDLSKYEAGKTIGNTLAKEYESQIDPLVKDFEKIKEKYRDAELVPDKTIQGPPDLTNPYDPKPGPTITTPGTVSKITKNLYELASKEGWLTSPSSDVMKEFNRTIKELPNLKTAKDLSTYITQVGDNTASTLPFGQQTPLSRAGALIKNVLRDAESQTAIQHLGEKEGQAAVDSYRAARASYANQARLKDYLNDYLKVGGSTSSFAKGLRNMAQTDGESILNRLSGKNSADLLDFLSKNYPETAKAIKNQHIDFLLQNAAEKANEGAKISVSALRKSILKMSPELRNFVISPKAQTKIDSIGQVLDKLEPKNYNFSNTARTITKTMSAIPGGVLGTAAALSGHGPVAAGLIAIMGKYFAHDIPDAMRLGLLKFLGSSAPLDSIGMKSALNSISATLKGENLLSKASKNIFNKDAEVLAETLHPTEKDRTKLQKQLNEIQNNPQSILNADNPIAHYMPEHGTANATTIARASQYLSSIKPRTQQAAPLDTPIKPTTAQSSAYNNALNIAIQPLVVMNKIKAGTATPHDVEALKAIYPNLYNRFASKLTSNMTEAVSKGVVIPYRTKLGISQFLNQPIDSTMSPASIMAAQPQLIQPQQAPPGQAPGERTKHNAKALQKYGTEYLTADQARQSRNRRED